MYGWGRYAGFGTLNYYGLLAQANLQDCDPRDSACVSNNVAKQAAVEDLWVSKYMVSGAPDDVKLNFAPQSAAEVREFYNPDPLAPSNVVDTRGILSVASGGKSAAYVPPVATPPPPAAKTPAKTADGKTIINSGGTSDTALPFTLPTVGGFTVPWWGWLAGAGVAVFALKGGR